MRTPHCCWRDRRGGCPDNLSITSLLMISSRSKNSYKHRPEVARTDSSIYEQWWRLCGSGFPPPLLEIYKVFLAVHVKKAIVGPHLAALSHLTARTRCPTLKARRSMTKESIQSCPPVVSAEIIPYSPRADGTISVWPYQTGPPGGSLLVPGHRTSHWPPTWLLTLISIEVIAKMRLDIWEKGTWRLEAEKVS